MSFGEAEKRLKKEKVTKFPFSRKRRKKEGKIG